MSSIGTLIDCIQSVFSEVNVIISKTPRHLSGPLLCFKVLRFRLGNLNMVLRSAKILGINFCPSPLANTEEFIRQVAEYIPPVLPVDSGRLESTLERLAHYLVSGLGPLRAQTTKFSVPLRDAPPRQSSSPTSTHQEVLDFISLSMENLENFQDVRSHVPNALRDALRALGGQMEFLKSLLLFVPPERKDVMAHAEAVAVDVALLLFDDGLSGIRDERFILLENVVEEMLLSISSVMQKIERLVYKTYIEQLCTGHGMVRMDDESLVATQKFLSSLISMLYEELARSTRVVVPVKDQLEELYEGLRSLRQIILRQQPNQLDLKMKDDIITVARDAGIFIFSLQRTHVGTNLNPHHDLLEAIKIILKNFGEKDAPLLMFNSGHTTQLALLDFCLEKLLVLTSNNVEPTAKIWAQTIQQELVSFKSFMEDTQDLPNDMEGRQALVDRVLEVTYSMEDLIECLMVGNLSYSVLELFSSVLKAIRDIESEIKVVKWPEIKVKKMMGVTHNPERSTTSSLAKDIVGFHDQASLIINRLTYGSKKLQMIAIVGMPGLGKTTLSEKVYDDTSVMYHFSGRAFTTVTQTFDRKGVLLDLLKQVDPDKYSQITSKTNADDAAQVLRRSLKGKRYLVVLDDVWEAKAWEELQLLFPDDSMGSRIILTSRHHDVAPPDMLDEKPLELGLFNEEESLNLLQWRLFGGNGWPDELRDLSMRIVELCNGLPLTIIIVAGLLRSIQPEDWERMVDSLSSGNLSERCRGTLELSYRHLPEHLKPCLVYFATFQEDEQIPVKKLLSLWMAEGFVRKAEMKRLSDVAQGYLDDLIGRSLVMVAKQTSMGRVKRCRIHDLLYEFCLQKAKDEGFFHVLEGGYDELSAFRKPRHLRRLRMHSDAEEFVKSKLFCPGVRSLRFKCSADQMGPSFSLMMRMCKFLRVLDMERIDLERIHIPSEIGQLVRLTYLATVGSARTIPASIGKLSNLETLVINVDPFHGPQVLEGFWNLQKLKHLSISASVGVAKFVSEVKLPMTNLENLSDLEELESISGGSIPYDGVERVLKKFPNLRHLQFTICGDALDRIVVPDSLTHLESFSVSQRSSPRPSVEFSLPVTLKQLTLGSFILTARMLSSIGEMPNLEYLGLDGPGFEEKIWRMEEGQFSRLRILKLTRAGLCFWSGCDDYQLGSLEKLVLFGCEELEEMPSSLETVPTLQMIKATKCSVTVTELVKKIGEVQADWGNSDMKIIISREVSQ